MKSISREEFEKLYSNVTITESEVYPCPSHNWISIKESLPKLDDRVLLFNSANNKIYIGEMEYVYDCENECDSHHWYVQEISEFLEDGNISHWMPLPNPPENEIDNI